MQHREYILREIEKIALIFGRILGLKDEGKTLEMEAVVTDELKKFDLTAEQTLALSEVELIDLITTKKLSPLQTNLIADLLYEAAELNTNQTAAFSLYKHVLTLYNLADRTDKTISFDRIAKRERVKKLFSV